MRALLRLLLTALVVTPFLLGAWVMASFADGTLLQGVAIILGRATSFVIALARENAEDLCVATLATLGIALMLRALFGKAG